MGANYSNSNRLSSKSLEIYKKLIMFREESLSNKLATGNKNPVGILAILNRHYAWNLPGVSKEQSKIATRTPEQIAAEYGKPLEIAQKPLEIPDA